MLLSYKWLQDYTNVPWDAEELAERLTMFGTMVESIEKPVELCERVVVGHVIHIEKHPENANLHVCKVDVGSDESITLVTGAPNVKKDIKVAVALEDARIGDPEHVIRKTTIAGVVSEGMLCSEEELGIGDDASGIIILPPDARIGAPFSTEYGLDDTILELELYPNRPDCQSVVGIAREVSALTQETLTLPELSPIDTDTNGSGIDIRIENTDLCSRYCAQIVENVQIGPSPLWMQRYLRAAGMRPINNVVDITNFVMLELGQPLHAFDYELLKGPKIIVRNAKPNETIRTLDGVDRALSEEMLVIADAERPVALAGVMGGADTEVTENTTTILLEAASFDGISVRQTSRKVGLQSEASARFEKGVDVHLPSLALARAVRLLVEIAGGTVTTAPTEAGGSLPEERQISLRPERVNRVLGTNLKAADMRRMLRALHFTVEETKDDRLQVHVPSFRVDITREADLIEEIARLHGYDNIPSTLPQGAGVQGKQSNRLEKYDLIRNQLTSGGLSEVITYSFASPADFDALRLDEDDHLRQAAPILNPLTEEMSLLRTTLIPHILRVISSNARQQAQAVRIFEIGAVFQPDALPLEQHISEVPTLAIGMYGTHTHGGWGRETTEVDFFDLKGAVEAALEALGVTATYEPVQHSAFHPGRTARITIDGHTVGVLGEIHPDVLERFGLERRAYVAEINISDVLDNTRTFRYEPISRRPAVRRDLALLAADTVAAADIEDIIRSGGGPLLREVVLFDVYAGKQVPEGHRSLAYTLVWQETDRTLTDEEIDAFVQRIVQELKEKCNVRVRE